ncbi:MAG TPA: phosphoribosyl-AMP cyclohydrolase [Hyphomicrobiaceae bacterium]|nr:phosphoribosyl-AMP cyclohydrolase [Hyphomicrobiaceae bacterium]
MASPSPLFAPRGSTEEIERGDVFQPKFGPDGLIPAIITDADTGDVLMFAWMNAEALALTIETGLAHFWTRSRQRIWKKGEESGNLLRVREIRTDCDQDVLWLKAHVEGNGVACHTGARSCFYRALSPQRTDDGAVRLVPAA